MSDEPTDAEIDRALAHMERLFGKDWLMEGMMERGMADDPAKSGIFRSHRCWKCNDGERPCVQGGSHRCEYPRARKE